MPLLPSSVFPASPSSDSLPSDSLSRSLRSTFDALWLPQDSSAQLGPAAERGTIQNPWPEWPSDPTGGDDGASTPVPTLAPGQGDGQDQTLALLLPLLLLLLTLLLLIFLLTLLLLRRRSGRISLGPGGVGGGADGEGGPIDLSDEEGMWSQAEGGFEGVEGRWLEEQEEGERANYLRGKAWQISYPPNSQPSEITLSQFLSIQEKGVSAWSFEPDYESNPSVVVVQRTEITFLDSTSPDDPCSVLSNLPVPKLNECYYWECKMFELPRGTGVSVGLATRPYPSFRLPGHAPHSLAYHSPDGFLSASSPFLSKSYGAPLTTGDVLGVGYRPRSGTVFFTRNGRNLGDAFIGFNKHNVFPSLGATGPATVHVNLGQAGFVFIEANVKKWGLGPMMGTLAPPPAYGSEGGSILLESAAQAAAAREQQQAGGSGHSHHLSTAAAAYSSSSSSSRRQHRSTPSQSSASSSPSTLSGQSGSTATAAAAAAALSSLSSASQPIRPSPLRHSHARQSSTLSSASNRTSRTATPDHSGGGGRSRTRGNGEGEGGSGEEAGEGEDRDDEPHNPPTPGLLDISLHSLHQFPARLNDDDSDEEEDEDREGGEGEGEEDEDEDEIIEGSDTDEAEGEDGEGTRLLQPGAAGGAGAGEGGAGGSRREGHVSPPPPEYNPIDPHMYAPGVAETILEDAFSSFSHPPSSSSHPSASSSSPSGYPGASRSSASTTSHPAIPAALGLQLNPAQAALLQRFVAERAAAASGSGGASGSGASSPAGRGYEGRTGSGGRGGAGNVGGGGGGGGFWGWLSGTGGGGDEGAGSAV